MPYRKPAWVRLMNGVVNPFVGWILRLPHGHRLLSRHLALLEIEPRSGASAYRVPVMYRASGIDRLEVQVGAPDSKRWWRNFRSRWPLAVWLEGRRRAGTGLAAESEGHVSVVVDLEHV